MNESTPVSAIKGVGSKTEEGFQKLGVYSVGDMLSYFPRDYVELPPIGLFPEKEGQLQALFLRVDGTPLTRRGRRMEVTTAQGRDGQFIVQLVWFRMSYIRKMLRSGQCYVFYGRLVKRGISYALEQPRVYKREDYEEARRRMIPVYPVAQGVKSTQLARAVKEIFNDRDLFINENLPEELCLRHDLVPRLSALRMIHQPADKEELITGRKRLVFEEFFFFLLGMGLLKEQTGKEKNRFLLKEDGFTEALVEKLPFDLTKAQEKVLSEMKTDLHSEHLMNRLLQGDVGSGKTILAFLLMAELSHNGYQSALMVPTEVLAAQHYETFLSLEKTLGLAFPVILLTGNMKAAEKKEKQRLIAETEGALVIGTHALFQEKVNFKNLALAVTDEQHRFGVLQREALSEKGEKPHILVMSATPIPRTLAIILYGDLDISVIDELPKNRLPIKNCVVNTSWREKAYHFIEKEVAAGHQAYVICPLVEESENLEAEDVVSYAATLSEHLPDTVKVEYLHGRMSGAEKTEKMERFAAGETDVLVSTTVIEVGINVPNATVMMVENAERFGLAALHQLRGRVGRGDAQSYCIFINTGDEEKNKRLEILNKSNDGFYIASEDLKLRGPGDFMGVRQSGDLGFVLADIYQDAAVLSAASEEAKRILEEDPRLSHIENEMLNRQLEKEQQRLLSKLNL